MADGTVNPQDLDDEYVRKHARRGEEWDQARRRLINEVAERYSQLPGCVNCSHGAGCVEEARAAHALTGLATCLGPDEKWPAEALEPELFKEALAQHQHRTEDLAAIARGHVHSLLVHMRNQDYPINAFMVSRELKGYLQSCRDLGLFGRDELMKLEMDLHESAQKAREAFIKQFRENNQSALPWR